MPAIRTTLAVLLAASVLAASPLAVPAEALAGAWTLPEGHGQFLLTATPSRADRAYDGDWSKMPSPRTNKLEMSGFLEYGVTDRFTAIINPGFQHIDIADPVSARRSGLGYTEIGGRGVFAQGSSWVLSGQTLLRVPGTTDNSNPAAIGYNANEVDIRALLGANLSFGSWPAFIDLQAAQRMRAGAAPDEFRADFTFGVRPLPQWLLLAQSFNVFSEGSGAAPFTSYEYHKLQLSVVYELTPSWALQLGGFTTFAGRNALQENGAVYGVWYKF